MLKTPFVDPGKNKHALPAPLRTVLRGHIPAHQCALLSLRGSCQERLTSPGTISSLEELWQTQPYWCRLCSQQGQSFINYSGDSAIMQISGQLCLIAAFYRSPTGDGDGQSPRCWVPGGSHLVCKRGNKAPRRWAHRGLCPEPHPTHRRAGRGTVLRTWGRLISNKHNPSTPVAGRARPSLNAYS